MMVVVLQTMIQGEPRQVCSYITVYYVLLQEVQETVRAISTPQGAATADV